MQGISDAWSLTKDTEAKTKLLIFCNQHFGMYFSIHISNERNLSDNTGIHFLVLILAML